MKLAAALFIVPAILGYVVVMTYLAARDWSDRRNGKIGEEL